MKSQKRWISTIALAMALLIPACSKDPVVISPDELRRRVPELSNFITALAFSRDGQTLFAGIGIPGSKVRSWNVETGIVLHEVEFQGSPVWSIAPSADNSVIALGADTEQNRFMTWDGTSSTPKGVEGVPAAWCVATGVRPGTFFCGSMDGAVTSIDLSTRHVTTVGKLRSKIGQLFFVPERGLLFAVSPCRELAVWRLESGEQVASLELDDCEVGILALTRDGRRVAIGDEHGILVVYAFKDDKFRFESRHQLGESLGAVAWSDDGRLLAALIPVKHSASGGPGKVRNSRTDVDKETGGILRVWNTDSWAEVSIDFKDDDIVGIAFSPIAPVIAVSHPSGPPTIVDIRTGDSRRLDAARRPDAVEAESSKAP